MIVAFMFSDVWSQQMRVPEDSRKVLGRKAGEANRLRCFACKSSFRPCHLFPAVLSAGCPASEQSAQRTQGRGSRDPTPKMGPRWGDGCTLNKHTNKQYDDNNANNTNDDADDDDNE